MSQPTRRDMTTADAMSDAMDELRIIEKLLDPDESLTRESRDRLAMILRRLLDQVAAGIADLEAVVKASRPEA